MNSALYIGATGMKGLSQGMQVTTNNLANVSTIGYKQQGILFSDLISTSQAGMGEWWNNQENSRVALGQTGKGVQVDTVRTSFQQGTMQSSNMVTDMAINGKGFFQVTDGVNLYYTRAGDFRPDNKGVWRTPTGLALNGYKYNGDGSLGGLQEVKIDRFSTMPGKGTARVDLTMNLNSGQDNAVDEHNPYFGMLGLYNATNIKPLPNTAYSYSQTMTLYDAESKPHTVTVYFDDAPDSTSGSMMEFLIAAGATGKTDADGDVIPPSPGDGLLMSGVLQFNSWGRLTGMSAFTPATEGSKNLADWQPAALDGGLPQLILEGATMSVNFGISAAGGWQNAPASAADVDTDQNKLPAMGTDAVRAEGATTLYNNSSPIGTYKQDGYSEGTLSTVAVKTDGTVVGCYSNGHDQNLWQIPICRFTSEDGLRREGGNLFSATDEAGQMDMGVPGTENYGTVNAYNIENSNVDMAMEMVNMIITQRGFQSNSKVVTTADQMLQKAMELKR
ncbi:flagellar hook protein FlgE [uncultured Desulfovibrio sp.]|uniref:flagellar hook protein FlgE n=1 Tax=uncultured Desulfovibrio sp. TaxID=167968 RepID=UPI002633A6AF|nr:flagellar hook-basal body complex protein [uncultured Desulfovibrio sp.]